MNVQDIGRDLGVRYILEGSVRRDDTRMRISAQLIETETGSHLWAERFDREKAEVFAVQDEVTRSIVAALHIEVPAAELQRVKRKDTSNLQAYDYVLRGRDMLVQFSQGSHELAKEVFKTAIELDPNYALAYTYLAVAYLDDWRLAWGFSRCFGACFTTHSPSNQARRIGCARLCGTCRNTVVAPGVRSSNHRNGACN